MCLVCDQIKQIQAGKNQHFVRELETGYVVLGDYQYFQGYTLFLCKRHEKELFGLEPGFQQKFLKEMTLVAEAVAKAFDAEKMNYELLGNSEWHLHWHLFPRRGGDLGTHGRDGSGPVWWLPKEIMYSEWQRPSKAELNVLKDKLTASLGRLIR